MRKVEGYVPGDVRLYVPESYDNRSDPDPVRVWIRQPTEHDKRAIFAVGEKILVDNNGSASIQTTATAQLERSREAIARHVDRVENYSIGGKQIATGAEFAQHAEPLLFVEVANEILLSLSFTEEQKKKQLDLLDTCSVPIPVSIGIAKSAEIAGSTRQEIAPAAVSTSSRKQG